MKKSLYIFAGLVAAMAVSCEVAEFENCENAPAKGSFSIVANLNTTKTANDNLNTNWASGDALSVFHAAAGETSFVSDGCFAIADEDLATGTFTGDLASALVEGSSYDWAFFYPYNSSNTLTAAAFSIPAAQDQNGNDSLEALAGESFPLYAKVEGVADDATVSGTMEHLASVVCVKVVNVCGKPLNVHTVNFTATENIAGDFTADLTSDPVITDAGNNAKKVSLSVSNPEAIENESYATFYIEVKPFTAASGSTLVLSVNGYNKPLVLSKDVTFEAGKIKTITFNFDYDMTKANFTSGMLNYNNGSSTRLAIPDGCKAYFDADWVVVDEATNKLGPKSENTGAFRSAIITYANATTGEIDSEKGVYVLYQHPGKAWFAAQFAGTGSNRAVTNKGTGSAKTGTLKHVAPNTANDATAVAVTVANDPRLARNVGCFDNPRWPMSYGGCWYANANGDIVKSMQGGYTIEAYACLPDDKTWPGEDGSGQSILFSYNANTQKAGTRLIVLGVKGSLNSNLGTNIPSVFCEIKSKGIYTYNAAPEYGKYFHVAMVYDPVKQEDRLYLNGYCVGKVEDTRPGTDVIYTGTDTSGTCKAAGDNAAPYNGNTVCNPWVLGGAMNGNYNACSSTWNGKIAFLNVYPSVLSDDEIKASYRAMNYAQIYE